jgi:hypothetical protein
MKFTNNIKKELSKTRFYSAATYEKYVCSLPQVSPVSIVDNGADNTILGDGWKVTRNYPSGPSSGRISSPLDPTRFLDKKVDAVATLLDIRGKPQAIIKVHRVFIMSGPGNETMISEAQVNWSGLRVDSKHGIFGGDQIIAFQDGRSIDLLSDGKTAFFKTRYPTHQELKKLPEWILTSELPYDPSAFIRKALKDLKEEDHTETTSEPVNPRCDEFKYDSQVDKNLPVMKNRRFVWDNDLLSVWSNRLGCVPNKVVQKTFEATTQRVPSVECENSDFPKQHFKPRFPFLRPRNLNEKVYSDTIFWTHNGNKKCGQVFICATSKYAYFYPLAKESKCDEALQSFFTDVGCPKILLSDNAQSEVRSSAWQKLCKQHFCKTQTTEPKKQHQNLAERFVQELKKMATKLFHRHQGSTNQFDNELFAHCVDLHNHTANSVIHWRTPFERMWGTTPDISSIRFKWWERVWYFEPKQSYPSRRMLPGRFLGLARNTGDKLCYQILTVPHESSATRPTVIVRSIVTPRKPGENAHGEFQRLRSDHYFPKYIEEETFVDDDTDLPELNPRIGRVRLAL